jgi:hypothetical protein
MFLPIHIPLAPDIEISSTSLINSSSLDTLGPPAITIGTVAVSITSLKLSILPV